MHGEGDHGTLPLDEEQLAVDAFWVRESQFSSGMQPLKATYYPVKCHALMHILATTNGLSSFKY